MATQDRLVTENVINVDISEALKKMDKLKKESIKAAKTMKTSYESVFKDIGKEFSSSSTSKIFGALTGNQGTQLLKNFRSDLSKLSVALTGINNQLEITRQRAAKVNLNASALGQADFQAKQYFQSQKMKENVASYQLEQSGVSRSDQQLAKRLLTLDKNLGLVQVKLMANYAAINSVTSGMKYLLNYTVQYDKELHQLQAIANISNTSLSKLKDTIGSVAAATKFTTLELAQASTVLAQAGLSATQISTTLPAIAKLATATGTDLATSTDVITSTLNVYSLQTSEAVNVTNALTTAMNESKADIAGFQQAIQYAGNVAAQLGLTYEETAAAIAAATQAGIRSKSMLGTGLRAVLTEFLKPTKKLTEQLQKVGLTIDDIDVKSKGFTTVLRTLKEAGFGATEAFRGMERRGAAFLAALLGQTEFIDDLRLKMVSSTAAEAANEVQMKSLANTFDNFKSIVGEATYRGLEPFIKSLQKLLEWVNSILQTKAGGVISSWLFGTIGTTATIAFLTTLVGSIKNMASALKGIGSVLKTYASLAGLKSITGVFMSGKSLAITAIVSALIVGLYKAVDAFGVFDTALDKARAKMDDTSGKLQAEKESYSTLNRLTLEYYSNRDKLDSQAERNIFVSKILSTMPEAAKVFKGVTVSVQELEEGLKKLNNISLANLEREYQNVAQAQQSLTKASMKEVSYNQIVDTLAPKLNQLLGDDFLSQKELMSIYESNRSDKWIKNPILLSNPLTWQLGGATYPFMGKNREGQRAVQEKLVAQLKAMAERSGDPSTFYTSLAARPEFKEDKEFLELLKNLSSSIDKLEEASDNLVKSKITATFGEESKSLFISSDQLLKETTNQIKALSIKMDSNQENGPTAEIYAQANELLTKLTEQQDFISGLAKAKNTDDLAKALSLSKTDVERMLAEVRNTTPEAKGMSEEALVSLIGRNIIEQSGLLEVNSRLTDAINNLNGALGGEGTKGASQIAKSLQRQINSSRSLLKGQSSDERAKTTAEIKGNILKAYQMSLAALGITDKRITNKDTNEALSIIPNKLMDQDLIGISPQQQLSWNVAIDNVKTQLGQLQQTEAAIVAAIDKTALKTDYFFRNLKARLKEIEDSYEEGLQKLQKPIINQEGILLGSERAYGSNSIVAQYQNLRLSQLQDNALSGQVLLDKQALARYQTVLKQLKANPLYNQYSSQYHQAEENYNEAMRSGNAVEMERTAKVLSNISDNYYKFTNQETSLNKTIRELEDAINKNTTALEEEANSEKLKTGDRFALGTAAGIGTYMDNQKQGGFQKFTGQWGYFTLESINSMESAFSDLFKTISEGSVTAGEAFKAFGRSIIQSMADIAAQMAAKAMIMALFKALVGGFSSSPAVTENGGFSSSFVSTGTMAQGGLVTGPVKNRDSVPTMLMPGEFVMKKSAVDTLGTGFLNSLNHNSTQLIQQQENQLGGNTDVENSDSSGTATGVVNVYVVSDANQAGMTPNDVLVTINEDLRKGGSTKQLVKQIAMGKI